MLACGGFRMLLCLTSFDVVAKDVALLLVVDGGCFRVFAFNPGVDGMNAGFGASCGLIGRLVGFCCG